MQKNSAIIRLVTAPAIAAALAFAISTPAQAQIPGALPSIEDVAPISPLRVDGVWRVREIDELIVLDSGHAYAVDGWTHALIFKILPGHVVLTDLEEQIDGTIKGRDLPLMAAITLTPVDDVTMVATVHSLIPVTYHLDFVREDIAFDADVPPGDDSWFPADSGARIDNDESWFPAED